MNARPVSIALAAGLLAGLAVAQQSTRPQPIPGEVRDAGTLHLATGTWSRPSMSTALAGPEVVYDNTCTIGLYRGVSTGETITDTGRVPSTSSPSNAVSLTGTSDSYLINGFDIGYCAVQPSALTARVAFYECYSVCTAAPLPSPVAAFTLTNLPFGSGPSPSGCWILSIDLANTTLGFQLNGDCDGVYDGVPATDDFAWSWTTLAPQTTSSTGPLLAGDPLGFSGTNCGAWGDGTTFPSADPNQAGTGLGTTDQYEASSIPTGCFFFGGYTSGNPYASFYMRLSGGPVVDPGSNAYCFGDGTSGPCPCGNGGNAGEGCGNSTGTQGATLTPSGTASISNDTLRFVVTGVPGSKPGLLLRAANQVTIPNGDGILCATGQSARSQVYVTSAGGGATLPDFGGVPFGAASYGAGIAANYQFWYRDPQLVCTGAGYNFTNAWTLVWAP